MFLAFYIVSQYSFAFFIAEILCPTGIMFYSRVVSAKIIVFTGFTKDYKAWNDLVIIAKYQMHW